MTLTNEEIIKQIAGILNRTEEEVSEELSNLVTRVEDEVKAHGESTIQGLGTFKKVNDKLEFIPDDTLALEINHKYAGMEEIEIAEPDKEGLDEEIEMPVEEPENESQHSSENEEESESLERTDDTEEEQEQDQEGPSEEEKKQKELETREQLEEVREKVRQLESKEKREKGISEPKENSDLENESPSDTDSKEKEKGSTSSSDQKKEAEKSSGNQKNKEKKEQKQGSKKTTTKGKRPRKRKPSKDRKVSGNVAIIIGTVGVVTVVVLVWVLVSYLGNQPNTNVLLGSPNKANSSQTIAVKKSKQSKTLTKGKASKPNSVKNKTAKIAQISSKKATDKTKIKKYGLKGDLVQKNSDFYTVVVYSLNDLKRAKTIKNKLAKENYRASLTTANVNNQELYRIGLGQFKNVKDAEEAAQNLPPKYRKHHFIKHVHLKSPNE